MLPDGPQDGFLDRDTVARAYTLVLISLPLSAILLPIFFLIFFLSDAKTRRTWIFVLSAVVLVLGIVQGALSTLVQTLIILHPQYQIPDWLFLTFFGIALYTSIVVDCVLILRLSAVYPAVLIRTRTRFALLFIPAVCTAARIACVTIVVNRWTVLAAQASASEATRQVWPHNPFIVANWSIQLLENTYCSVLFVARLATRKVLSSRMYREQSFTMILRGLIYIAVGNFIFPAILSGVQLVYVLHDRAIYNGAAVLLVNNVVSILGAVFSTIWSTSDVWKSKRRQAQAMDLYGAQSTCDSFNHRSRYSIRQSAISLSGIAPNLTPLPAPERASFTSRLSLSSLSLSMRSVAGKSLSYSKRSSTSSGAGGMAGRRLAMMSREDTAVGTVISGSGKLSKSWKRKLEKEREREREKQRERELERVRRRPRTPNLEAKEKVVVESDPASEGQDNSADSHTPILRRKRGDHVDVEDEEGPLEEVVLETPKQWVASASGQAGLVTSVPATATQPLPSNSTYPPLSRIPSSRFLKTSSSSHSFRTQHTMDTDTDFDFGSPTPPPQLFQSTSSSRPRAHSHSTSIARSLASSAYTSNTARTASSSEKPTRDEMTVIDFRRMENRTPPAMRGRGREEDVRWPSQLKPEPEGKARSFFLGRREPLLGGDQEGRRPSETTLKVAAGTTPTSGGVTVSPSPLSKLFSRRERERDKERDLEAAMTMPGIVPWQ